MPQKQNVGSTSKWIFSILLTAIFVVIGMYSILYISTRNHRILPNNLICQPCNTNDSKVNLRVSVWESLIPAMVTPLRFCWFFYMLWGPMRIVYHKIFRSIGPLLHTEILSTTPNFTKSIFLVFPWFLGNFPGYKDFFGMN